MTERYLGSIISPSPTEPSEGFADSTASGVWNVHDPLIFGQAGDWPDPTNASPSKFIENLFSCFAYTGTGSSQTITNGIDFSGSGGLLWIKNRENVGGYAQDHSLIDTERGHTVALKSNSNSANITQEYALGTNGSFNSNGFTQASTNNQVNASGTPYMSWSFRKQPKFFDIVTATADSSGSILINHNLGTTPGFVMIKRTDSTSSWFCYHRGLSSPLDQYLTLNTDGVAGNFSGAFSNVTSTTFQSNLGLPTGSEVVFYLFAHNNSDGGFGSTGDQDIIKCGSYTGNGSASNSVTLGFEPQFLLIKNASGSNGWLLFDNIRGITHYGADDDRYIFANSTDAEGASGNFLALSADGFKLTVNNTNTNTDGSTYIYMAIRRGPMQTPTAATSVFNVQKYTGDGTQARKITTNFVVDANITSGLAVDYRTVIGARLFDGILQTSQTTNQYYSLSGWMGYDHNDGYIMGEAANYGYQNANSVEYISYSFSRAPKFFDVITYTGTGSEQTLKHNLGAVPELIIRKKLSASDSWEVASQITSTHYNASYLNTGGAATSVALSTSGMLMGTPTSTQFNALAASADFVNYLFATLAGISKVGSYSGTGSDVNVDCGFTSGARFVLIKRTDSSGDWYHWDSVNGIVAGNDPYLLFNSDAAQVTNTDYIDPLSSGFTITSNAGSDLNTNGGTYLFLAIA